MAGWKASIGTRSGAKPWTNSGRKDGIDRVASEIVGEVADTMHYHAVGGILNTRSTWPPLHPMTVAMKGFDKPLIHKGDFLRSIQVEKDGKEAYVGVMTSKGSRGQDLGMIAAICESGATIPVSDKMRGWFSAQGFPLKNTTAVIKIPPRPVFAPAVEETVDDLDAILQRHVNDLVEEVLGA